MNRRITPTRHRNGQMYTMAIDASEVPQGLLDVAVLEAASEKIDSLKGKYKVEVVLTRKSDIKAAQKVKRASHSAKQCLDSGNAAGFELWILRADIKKHDLAKSMGLLPVGVSGKDVFIAINDDCTKIMAVY